MLYPRLISLCTIVAGVTGLYLASMAFSAMPEPVKTPEGVPGMDVLFIVLVPTLILMAVMSGAGLFGLITSLGVRSIGDGCFEFRENLLGKVIRAVDKHMGGTSNTLTGFCSVSAVFALVSTTCLGILVLLCALGFTAYANPDRAWEAFLRIGSGIGMLVLAIGPFFFLAWLSNKYPLVGKVFGAILSLLMVAGIACASWGIYIWLSGQWNFPAGFFTLTGEIILLVLVFASFIFVPILVIRLTKNLPIYRLVCPVKMAEQTPTQAA
ncbi:MAG TPA: hypothetical protein VJH33_00975 [Candidatus Paceibacterota bacterium]